MMMGNTGVLAKLTELSNRLGVPSNDYVILSEGNTSARIDDMTFWIKASGASLRSSTERSFVRVAVHDILRLLDCSDLKDDELRIRLDNAVRPEDGVPPTGRPSIETLLHAVCLQAADVHYVAHTHPSAVTALVCSNHFAELAARPLFPDQIVVCGQQPLFIDYADPGRELALAVNEGLNRHIADHGGPPRAIYLKNHGFVALGSTAREVECITAMAVKAARILAGTMAFGGPCFMPDRDVHRIAYRSDERYRRKKILDEDVIPFEREQNA
ncbi:MAG: aldolase [Planctomycetes bacterium]|nr:aldolase [Planctomycetota bacterium]NOG54488.1 aldolase [Planctomycetota bacterium]